MDKAHTEMHDEADASRMNWLRAAVLGSNDGIVSVSALVVGVAGANAEAGVILITGIAGMLAGSLSMAVGEYVSVSTQRDTQKALLAKETYELEHYPEEELEELTTIYQKKGLSRETAARAAQELTEHDALSAHLEAELHIDAKELTNPWHAAIASGLSFVSGAIVPILAITLPPEPMRIPATFVAVLLVLVVTGILSAHLSGSNVMRATVRVVAGGVVAMAITFGIGRLFGVAVG